MARFTVLSPAEQVADHLRKELKQEAWLDRMPGAPRLSKSLDIDPKTVMAALNLLEKEGWLSAAETGKRRRILRTHFANSTHPIRIAILDYEPLDRMDGHMLELQRALERAGYSANFTDKGLRELKMDVTQVARLVDATEADAWVVCAASRQVLEWFLEHEIPAFALFGRRRELPIAGAGPDKVEAFRRVVRRLVELGHQSLVLIALHGRRQPSPGAPERAFLDELACQGLRVSSYNLPDWNETPEGLQHLLDALFQITPPTGLLVEEAYLFHAVKHHLSHRRIMTPSDVSLICSDPDRTFEWCRPSVAHIDWGPNPLIRRILRWVKNVSRGKEDHSQTNTEAEFIEGGTIGPPPIRR